MFYTGNLSKSKHQLYSLRNLAASPHVWDQALIHATQHVASASVLRSYSAGAPSAHLHLAWSALTPQADCYGRQLVRYIQRTQRENVTSYGIGLTELQNAGLKMPIPKEVAAEMAVAEHVTTLPLQKYPYHKTHKVLIPNMKDYAKAINLLIKQAAADEKCQVMINVQSFLYQQRQQVTVSSFKDSGIKVRMPFRIQYMPPDVHFCDIHDAERVYWQRLVDHMLCVFPSQKSWCEFLEVPYTYVGHPLLALFPELAQPQLPPSTLPDKAGQQAGQRKAQAAVRKLANDFRAHHGLPPAGNPSFKPVLAVVPDPHEGSMKAFLPFLDCVLTSLRPALPTLSVFVVSEPFWAAALEDAVANFETPVQVVTRSSVSDLSVLAAADVALVGESSQTALECALLGTPMVALGPKPVGGLLGLLKRVVTKAGSKVKSLAPRQVSIVNSELGEAVVPEVVFSGAAQAQEVAIQVQGLVEDIKLRQRQRDGLSRFVAACLKEGSTPVESAGRAILDLAAAQQVS